MTQAFADDLVQKFDPAFPGINTHDRQGPAHRHSRIAGQMRKIARLRFGCTLWRVQAQHKLIAGMRALFEYQTVFDEYRIAMRER